MTETVILVDNLKDWTADLPDQKVVAASDYLNTGEFSRIRHLHVINLCSSYKYQSVGYYCSLLAEARGHRIMPSVRTIQDLSRKSLYRPGLMDLAPLLRKKIPTDQLDKFSLQVFFGEVEKPEIFQTVGRQLFDFLPCPLLELSLSDDPASPIRSVRPLSIRQLGAHEKGLFVRALTGYLGKRWRNPRAPKNYRYDLAILHNPEEDSPPSDMRALNLFVDAGKKLGIDVELIGPRDYNRLLEFDALFIRETTQINHHTYRFARRASHEGMVVIDDPDSILKCTNKVYLAELLHTHKLPAPRTIICRRQDLSSAAEKLGFPVIFKIPEGSFSRGVFKAENDREIRTLIPALFANTELVLAQEYIYTSYDWRIGVLNRQPIYASLYHMARKHWQVVNHHGGRVEEGGYTTLPIEAVPPGILNIAVRAANLIGDGLYGVDLKQKEDAIYVIEINDNPSIESGVEDGILKKDLYTKIMAEFLRRLEAQRQDDEVSRSASRTG